MTSDETAEAERLENLMSPLFDMWLRFERAFTAKAIDRLDVSNEDAETFAKTMEETESGRAFAYLLRSIRGERSMRLVCHKAATVLAANSGEMIGLREAVEAYERLPKGVA